MPFGVARLHSCEDEISAGTTTSGTVALLLPLASASFATRDAMTTVPVAESRIARATARGHTDSASLHNDLQRATDAFLLQSRNAWMKSKQGKAPDAPPNSARVINTHCHRDGSFAGREGVKSKTGVPPAPSKAVSARLVGIRATRPVSCRCGTSGSRAQCGNRMSRGVRVLRSTARVRRVRDAKQVGVYWESDGFRQGDTVEVSVQIERVNQLSKVRRIGMAFRVSMDPNFTVTARWTEPQPGRSSQSIPGTIPILARHITRTSANCRKAPIACASPCNANAVSSSPPTGYFN